MLSASLAPASPEASPRTRPRRARRPSPPPLRITQSALSVHASCPRKYYLKYVANLRPIGRESMPLSFGSGIHAGLEELLRNVPLDAAIARAVEVAGVAEGPTDEAARTRVALDAILRHYVWRWSDLADEWEVLAVETPFKVAPTGPTGRRVRTHVLEGKIDGLVRERSTGLVWILEHKTTSRDFSPTASYWDELRFGRQIGLYVSAARALGHEPAGVIYDMLKRPSLKPESVPVLDADGLKIVHDAGGCRVKTMSGTWRQVASPKDGYVLLTRPQTPDEFSAALYAQIVADTQRDPNSWYARRKVALTDRDIRGIERDIAASVALVRAHRSDVATEYPRNPDACRKFGQPCAFLALCEAGREPTAHLDDDAPEGFVRVPDPHVELL